MPQIQTRISADRRRRRRRKRDWPRGEERRTGMAAFRVQFQGLTRAQHRWLSSRLRPWRQELEEVRGTGCTAFGSASGSSLHVQRALATLRALQATSHRA